jgi:hypothetical protein
VFMQAVSMYAHMLTVTDMCQQVEDIVQLTTACRGEQKQQPQQPQIDPNTMDQHFLLPLLLIVLLARAALAVYLAAALLTTATHERWATRCSYKHAYPLTSTELLVARHHNCHMVTKHQYRCRRASASKTPCGGGRWGRLQHCEEAVVK